MNHSPYCTRSRSNYWRFAFNKTHNQPMGYSLRGRFRKLYDGKHIKESMANQFPKCSSSEMWKDMECYMTQCAQVDLFVVQLFQISESQTCPKNGSGPSPWHRQNAVYGVLSMCPPKDIFKSMNGRELKINFIDRDLVEIIGECTQRNLSFHDPSVLVRLVNRCNWEGRESEDR